MVIGAASLDCIPSFFVFFFFFVFVFVFCFCGRVLREKLEKKGGEEQDRREMVFGSLGTKLSIEDQIGRF